MPPLTELTSVRALVEFDHLRSDLLADYRPMQAAIVTRRLAWTTATKHGWRQSMEDVTQEAQLKLCKKLHRTDEWTVPAEAIATRCADDAAIEFNRREAGQPELGPPPEDNSDDVRRGSLPEAGAETVWDHIVLPELVGKAVELATRAAASLQDARLWAWGDVVDPRFRLSGKELGVQFGLQPNAAYQGIHRARQKVLVHLVRELRLTADESAVLANDMRAKNRLSSDQLAKERDMTKEGIEQLTPEVRARVADYIATIEADR